MYLNETLRQFEISPREADAIRCRPPLPEGIVAPETVSLYDDAALRGLQQLLFERLAAKNGHMERIQRMADRGHVGQTTAVAQAVERDVSELQDAFMQIEEFMNPTWAATIEGIANEEL